MIMTNLKCNHAKLRGESDRHKREHDELQDKMNRFVRVDPLTTSFAAGSIFSTAVKRVLDVGIDHPPAGLPYEHQFNRGNDLVTILRDARHCTLFYYKPK